MISYISIEWNPSQDQRGKEIPENHKNELEAIALTKIGIARKEHYYLGWFTHKIDNTQYSCDWCFKSN